MPDHPALERYEQVLTTEGFHSINQAVFLADGMRDEYEARLNTKDDRIEALEAELAAEREKRCGTCGLGGECAVESVLIGVWIGPDKERRGCSFWQPAEQGADDE